MSGAGHRPHPRLRGSDMGPQRGYSQAKSTPYPIKKDQGQQRAREDRRLAVLTIASFGRRLSCRASSRADEERTSTMHRHFVLLFTLGTFCLVPAMLWAGGEDQKVRAVFQSLQKALKAGDAATIWKLLDAESQEAATRNAKTLQAAYA